MWIEMKRHFEARSSEWLNAAILLLWGSYVVLHPGLFDGPLSNGFAGMEYLASQEVWGLSAFTAGCIRIFALFVNGRWGLTPVIRIVTSFMSILVWFWIAVGIYLAGTPAPGIIIYLGLMVSDIHSAFRAAGDAYQARALKRLKDRSEEEVGSNVVKRSFGGR